MTNIDLSFLCGLLGGDETLVQRFIGIFKSQTPELLAQIRQGFEMQDWYTVSVVAHSLKSQSLYFGLAQLAGLAEQVELDPQAPETAGRLLDLEKHMNTVLRNLG